MYQRVAVTFIYDAINRLTSLSDFVVCTITWTYDTLSGGHRPRMQESTTPGTATIEYDEIGRRLKLSATGQPDATYAYDQTSRLTAVIQGSLAVSLTYDAANRRTALSYPNGTQTSYAYDLASRLTGITHNGPSGVIEALTYTYDAAGNRISQQRANGPASLIPQAVTSASYDAANEQIAFAGATLTYDQNGNLTHDGVNTYQWDARNRLMGISGGTTAGFTYDVLGRRVKKTLSTQTSAVSTEFLYDGYDIAAELGGGAVGADYLRSLSIDEPFIRQSSTGNEHYHTDALGSSLALSNSQGTSATTYAYEPFGKTTVAGTSANAFQFTGRENDGTGLHYYRARYYSPKLQKMISEDPIGFWGGDANLYVYVYNIPVRFSDPLGLAVGDWWDLPANFERSQQIAREELAKRPMSHNDMGDAMRHAEWMRRTTVETNTFTSWIAGTGHEIEGALQGQPWREMLMDLHNNAVGRQAGIDSSAVDPKRLWTLPLKTWQYNPYFFYGRRK